MPNITKREVEEYLQQNGDTTLPDLYRYFDCDDRFNKKGRLLQILARLDDEKKVKVVPPNLQHDGKILVYKEEEVLKKE